MEVLMLTEQDLAQRVGPVLSDGTPLRSLIDLDKREVAMRVINDPEVHELELNRIFATAWVLVGHEAEIPSPGDYVSRYIGEDNVLVVRGEDGTVNVLLNVCAHRGMEICRSEEGNARTLMCPYHGWVYDHDGRLLGAPYEQEFYGDWNDKSGYGLIRARVGLSNGVIFATFSDEAPPLDEYIGDFKWYLDYACGGGREWEVSAPAQRFRIAANWKTLSDQLAGDGYHAATLHRGLWEVMGQVEEHKVWFQSGHGYTNVSTQGGHALLSADARVGKVGDEYLIDPEEPFTSLAIQLFPASNVLRTGPNGVSIGGLLPKGPGAFEMWSVSLVTKDASADMRRMGRGQGAMSALIFADDSQQGPSMQRASRGAVARARVTFKYNSNYASPQRPESWPGPGLVYHGYPKEDNQWNWWTHWFDVMTADQPR
jgi:phenylpropionate dioxygenase-like ring-hydroxylating dioxygenase large terminal subunit